MLVVKQSAVARVKIDGFKCERCDYEWVPRKKDVYPTVCPNKSCHSPYWDRPRQDKPAPVVDSNV